MRDDIDFFTACLFGYSFYFFRYLRGAVGNSESRLLISVKDRRAVFFKFFRNASPLVQIPCIAEKDSVHEKKGVFCLADGSFFSLVVPFLPFFLRADIKSDKSYNFDKDEQVRDWDKPAKYTRDAPFDADNVRGQIYSDNSVPEKDQVGDDDYREIYQEMRGEPSDDKTCADRKSDTFYADKREK